MGKIIPKLNLNKTPQNVENNSLMFAKNIKLLKDGAIAPDIAWSEIVNESLPEDNEGIKGYIVGVNSKVYFFINRHLAQTGPLSSQSKVSIVEYDEETGDLKTIKCGWNYSGGKITGYATVNNTNEVILSICEYFENKNNTKKIPIKHINLSQCSEYDDESLYTQAPNIPITNFTLVGTYTKNIPNGVYQFFIRYRIREDFYTNWFPCSKECFAGGHIKTNTIKGSLRYVDTNKDASKSFIFSVEHLIPENTALYKDFQVGFIISNDDATVARSWKSFDFKETNTIYFDYEQSAIETVNVDDMIKATYELFNVRNITYFRNKLYISNYEETNFNPDLRESADNVQIQLASANPEYAETSGSQTTIITIGDKQLGKSDASLIYYDTWGGTPINKIATNKDLTTYNFSDSSNIGTYADILKLTLKFDDNVDPDLIWVNKGVLEDNVTSVDDGKHSLASLEFTAPNEADFQDTDNGYVLSNTNDYNHAIDAETHPFSKFINLKYKWYLASPNNRQGNNIIWGQKEFVIHNNSFGNVNTCKSVLNNWYDDIFTSLKKDVFPSAVIHNVYIMNNSTPVYLFGEDVPSTDYAGYFKGYAYFSNNITEDTIKNQVIGQVLYPKITSIINQDGTLYYRVVINENVYVVTSLFITYSTYEHKKDSTAVTVNGTSSIVTSISGDFVLQTRRTVHRVTVQPTIKASIVTNGTVEYQDVQYNTLMPFTGYEFYIHYIKQNGIMTNGYIIKNNTNNIFSFNQVNPSNYNPLSKPFIIYPKFSNIVIPNGYVGCFFSVAKVGDDVAKLFRNKCIDDTNKVFVANCLEADALLYNANTNIDIINNNGVVVGTGNYYSSGTTEPSKLKYFGDVGVIEWKHNTTSETFTEGAEYNTYWIKLNSKIVKDTNKQLIKITPFIIGESSFDNYNLLNSPGHLSIVHKLEGHNDENDFYYSGNDLFTISVVNNNLSLNNYTSPSVVTTSDKYYILSNFNLNYLSITDDLIPKLRTYNSGNDTVREFIIATQSLTDSGIYELKSMYRDYIRKYYNIYKDDYITEFNNTIRSSDTNIDEAYRNIYSFDSLDYYNIPTNKGKITNLFSVVNNIYVHTEHSFFKFVGTNTIQGVEGDIALKEGDVFDTGISEIFDSQYGYAGLQKKEHSLVTFDNYIFYDALARTIYVYGGNTQLMPISDSIQKLFDAYNVIDVLFVADTQNDRFFINLKLDTGNICLSYNYRVKSIISIHDIDFDIAFNTRSKCYMGRNFSFGYCIYIDNQKAYNNYGKLYMLPKIIVQDMFYPFTIDQETQQVIPYYEGQDNYVVENCVDIVCNINYEMIKTLDYINWICSEIIKYVTTTTNPIYTGEEELNTQYGGNKLRLYSDQCSTALISLVDDNDNPIIANNYNIENRKSYEYPRFNCGVWTLNYFRDIRTDNNDYFHYETSGVTRDKSLIYGKYFILRLIFKNRNFKLENVTFNISDYGKV